MDQVALSRPQGDAGKSTFFRLAVGAAGVVYGDIGTSLVYAFRESIAHVSATGHAARGDVVGVISLMLWALIAIVSIKYAFILMRFDNKGEGGTLALMALVRQSFAKASGILLLVGMAGAG